MMHAPMFTICAGIALHTTFYYAVTVPVNLSLHVDNK